MLQVHHPRLYSYEELGVLLVCLLGYALVQQGQWLLVEEVLLPSQHLPILQVLLPDKPHQSPLHSLELIMLPESFSCSQSVHLSHPLSCPRHQYSWLFAWLSLPLPQF
nr:hypothetical protein Iba_chr02cCG14070 [Ipomoea batatas]